MPEPPVLRLQAVYPGKLNWSFLRAGMPPIWHLALTNLGTGPVGSLQVRLHLPDFLDARATVPPLSAGATYELPASGWRWTRKDFEKATRLTASRTSSWEIEVGTARVDLPVELLAPDEWCAGVGWDQIQRFHLDNTVEVVEAEYDLPPGGAPTWEQSLRRDWPMTWPLALASAALVLPTVPAVLRIKQQALLFLDAITGQRQAPPEQWAGGSHKQKSQLVQAVFTALLDLFPRAVHDREKFSMEDWTQRVRLGDEAVAAVSTGRQGATCVDYALLVSAVLEACHLEPLFVLSGSGDGVCHALVGCWQGRPRRNRPALHSNAAEIQQLVAKGDLLMVDVTEFARAQSFQHACELGEQCLHAPYEFCYGLDIAIARHQHRIEPLPWPASPQEAAPAPGPLRPSTADGSRLPGPPRTGPVARVSRGRGGVLGVVGVGGSGKTALVEHFLCELPGSGLVCETVSKCRDLPVPGGLFVWSFYESTDCTAFLVELDAYLRGTRDGAPITELLSRTQETLAGTGQGRTLLVLDGLEQVQKTENILGQFTANASPVRQLLLRIASGEGNTWVVCTTRFPLVDLGSQARRRGYLELTVDELPVESARALLVASGVNGESVEQLDGLLQEFGRHALTLTHLGQLLGMYYGGDPAEAVNLPPLAELGGTCELDEQAQRLGRVLARSEDFLGTELLAILKAVSVFRVPVDQETIRVAAARILRQDEADQRQPPRHQLLANLSRLTQLKYLQQHPGKSAPLYSAHPVVSQYFYRALREDALLVHQGATEYLRRELADQDFRAPIRGGVRTRGASVTRHADRGARDAPEVLDLLEELIYHTLEAGQFEEAYTLYSHNLGGFERLGRQLHDYPRGERVVGLFLPPAPTAPPPGAFAWLADLEGQHNRYVQALNNL